MADPILRACPNCGGTDRYKDGTLLAPLINEALQELVNRRDFRHGFIETGRAITHLHDHQAVKVTVDVNRLSIPICDPA